MPRPAIAERIWHQGRGRPETGNDQTLDPITSVSRGTAPRWWPRTSFSSAPRTVPAAAAQQGDAKGYIRAYDARTGSASGSPHHSELRESQRTWLKDSWSSRATRVWGQMTVDEELGIAYPIEMPTATISAAPAGRQPVR